MSAPDSTGISAVLLAAGESQRMGAINKLALSIEGEPLLQRSARVLAEADLAELIVVVGHEHETSRELLRDIPARIAYNSNFRDGQMESVRCGLAALTIPCSGIMICLSDQALLERADINFIARSFLSCPTSIMVPHFNGQRGNPIVLAYTHRDAMLADGMNPGCRRLIEQQPELVTALDMPNDHVLVDLDTPQAYTRLKNRLRRGQQVAEQRNMMG